MNRQKSLFLYSTVLFFLCYFTYGFQGNDMPWGLIDPIHALQYININNNPGFLSPASLNYQNIRPLNLLPYLIVTKSPFAGGWVWYLYKSFLIFLSGLSFFLFIHEFMGRKRFLFPACAGLLFVVYPAGGWERLNQVLIVSQFSMACIFLSYYLIILSLRADGKWKQKMVLIIPAILLNISGFFMYEVSAVISFGLGIMILIRNGRDRLKESVMYFSLFLLAPVLNLIYKIIVFPRSSYSTSDSSVAKLLTDPVLLVKKLFSGLYTGFIETWGIAVYTAFRQSFILKVVFFFFLSICFIFTIALARTLITLFTKKALPQEVKIYWWALISGLFFVLCGYFPLLVAEHYPLSNIGRVHDYAIPGITLVIVSGIFLASSEIRKFRTVFVVFIVSIMVFFGAMQYFRMEYALTQVWAHEKPMWVDIVKQAPSFKKHTVVVMRGYPNGINGTESFYSSLIITGLYNDYTLTMLVYNRDIPFKHRRDNYTVLTNLDIDRAIGASEVNSIEPLMLGFYLTQLNKKSLLPPEKEVSIPSERIVVFDYSKGRAIMNRKLSNLDNVSSDPAPHSIFFKHFLGVSGKLEDSTYYKINPAPVSSIETEGLTTDGWVTSAGITIWVPSDFIRPSRKLILKGSYPQVLPPDCTVSAKLLSTDGNNRLLPTHYSFKDSKYLIQISLPEGKFISDDTIAVKVFFSKYFIPKELGINTDTRQLVFNYPLIEIAGD
jgi:hypothetical protein